MDIGNSFGMVDTYLPTHIIAIRLAIAALLGALIGVERELHTAEAGLPSLPQKHRRGIPP